MLELECIEGREISRYWNVNGTENIPNRRENSKNQWLFFVQIVIFW